MSWRERRKSFAALVSSQPEAQGQVWELGSQNSVFMDFTEQKTLPQSTVSIQWKDKAHKPPVDPSRPFGRYPLQSKQCLTSLTTGPSDRPS